MRPGETVGVAADGGPDADRPWYWNLPKRDQDTIEQSMDDKRPEVYQDAIKRYYERLSNRGKGGK